MTGDVNLTHIRERLIYPQLTIPNKALAQLTAAEAVIQAARAVLDYENHPTAAALRDLRSALAALEDGQ